MSDQIRNRKPIDEITGMKGDAIAARIINAIIGVTVIATLALAVALVAL